ncbi:O-acyltransferase like protein-like [Bicyclus anynana]|uniref:O-acyltransferase like protein-like n=1 Tax=Bicyclus anynana TaxID=110368 RepID=A0ABM3LXX3_BICAN|nr:O-acyltransferase like protein-like [Bicyclus anynana]
MLLEQCYGVIYYLNDTEHSRMPPIYHVDNYTGCLQRSSDLYCTVNFNLVSDEPSDLLNLIQEYSEATATHFNYTKLRHGVCVTQNCQRYIRTGVPVRADSLEECLNDTVWKDYKLKTKVESHFCHALADHSLEVDTSDILVAVVLLTILLLNAVGSIYDTKCTSTVKERKDQDKSSKAIKVSAGLVRSHCRSRWWQNLLYINNYFYNTQCIAAAWYLGVDMQMFVLGLVTCMALRSKVNRSATLTMLFFLGITIHAVHIYVRDLDAILILGPDKARTLFESDPSFNETYKMGHANVASYVVGLALGYLVYRLQELDIDVTKYRNYRYLYWALLPLLFVVILSGSVFYRDAPRDPLYIRVLYGALVKPTFGILVAGLICGTIFKLENIYRRVFEWKAWTIPSRLSYCVYVIHLPYLRLFVSLRTSLLTQTMLHQLTLLLCVTVISFATALPLWLLVEAPFVSLARHLGSRKSVKPLEKPDPANGCQKIDCNTYL